MSDITNTHIKTTFEVDGRIVGTTWIRRDEGFYDDAFTIARRIGKVWEADVAIFTDGHPQVPALTDREYRGTCGYGVHPILGVE